MVAPLSAPADPGAAESSPHAAAPNTSTAATVLHSHRFKGWIPSSRRFDLEQPDRPGAAGEQHPQPSGAHRSESDAVVLVQRGRVAGRAGHVDVGGTVPGLQLPRRGQPYAAVVVEEVDVG